MKKLTAISDIAPETGVLAGIDMIGNFKALFDIPFQIPGCLFLICTRGECTVNIHLNSYVMKKDAIAVVFPEQFFQLVRQSPDCRFLFAAFRKELIKGSSLFTKTIELVPRIYENPVINLSKTLSDFLNDFLHLLIKATRMPEKWMLKEQFQVFYYQLMMYLASTNPKDKVATSQSHYNRNQEIVKELSRLIIDNYKQERNISFYAEKMHLSPQHLSTTIKKTTGKTLTDIISNFVINDAQGKLKSTELTIQEIAYSLNFPDISFFGKYFKRYTGMSPKQYRNQQ